MVTKLASNQINGNAQNNCVVTTGGLVYTPTTGVLTGQMGVNFTYAKAV